MSLLDFRVLIRMFPSGALRCTSAFCLRILLRFPQTLLLFE
jgi:hypothetical protein